MVTFPNCKINLGLRVTRKRTDGFHDIATVFYPVPLHDCLEINPGILTEFHSYGLPIPGDPSGNLVLRAWEALRKEAGIPHVSIHLLKNIPMGAGLGGGSSDAAFALKLLREQFCPEFPDTQLQNLALTLGSDVPFFLVNRPCRADGRGEILETLPLDLAGNYLVLALPEIHIRTAWAFGEIQPGSNPLHPAEGCLRPIQEWKESLVNDFEKPIFQQFPLIRKIKENLYSAGALYASMSGSGSAVFGIFNHKPELKEFPDSCQVKILTI